MSKAEVIDGTFAALVSVGHTEEQARQAVLKASSSGKTYGSVSEMVDAIYRSDVVDHPAEPVAEEETPEPEPTEAERNLEEIREAYQGLALDTLDAERRHLEYKAAKEKQSASQAHLNDVIRRQLEDMPLFDRPKPSGNGEATTEPDDDWRAMPVETLCNHGLSPMTAQRVGYNPGLDTLGDLADWTAGGKRLTEIPGIGTAKAEAIEAASVAFFEARNQAGPEQADVESGDPDSPRIVQDSR